ncbi:hypothetical protein [Halobacteriovorax sp. JY17]|uniref:hypothetical protein n=1 Tax=Halobacteriovorax sp. JY17 TaxID=2014617 RepID=UPI0025C1159C|nr:hypothetical protein [Halobacteriovorax sp. JY17]
MTPFILGMILFRILNSFLFNKYLSDKLRIVLKNDSAGSFTSFFDTFCWANTCNFKNNPSSNIIFFRSIYIVSFFTIIIIISSTLTMLLVCGEVPNSNSLIKKLDYIHFITFYFAYFSAFSTLFWKERNKFKEKWEYLNNLYNDLLDDNVHVQEIKLNALSIDCIVMLQWGHRSLRELVYIEVFTAVSYFFTDESKESIASKVNTATFTEKEIIFLLENYQTYLDQKSSTQNISQKQTSIRHKTMVNDWFKIAEVEYISKNKFPNS